MAKEKRQRVVMPQLVKCEEAAGGGGRGEVGSLVDSSQADDRRLIQLVRARRLLYARNNMPVASYYTQVKCLWDDVAKEMGWSVADVRRKWSHIRNSYSRHLRNELHGACTSKGRMVSRWYLADELDFLREHMATDMRPSPYSSYAPSFLEMDLGDASPPEPDVKPFLHNPWFALGSLKQEPGPERAPPSVTTDDSCSSAAFTPDETSSYFQFFRGIHADYQELSARGRRQFKRRCFGLLHELLDEEEAAAHHPPAPGALNLSHSATAHDSDDDREPAVGGHNIPPLS